MAEIDDKPMRCWRCGVDYDGANRLQTIRHEGAFCLSSRGTDQSPDAKERRRVAAKRGWQKRRSNTAENV